MTGDLAAPPSPGVLETFSRIVGSDPGRTAVIDDRGGLSYGELDLISSRLAQALRELIGTQPQIIGVVGLRNRWFPAAALGVVRSGHAYAPLDPFYPEARLRYIKDDASIRCTITADERGIAIQHDQDEIVVNADSGAHARATGPAALVPSRPGRIAYVIHTSGSTGSPKGVLVTYANISWLVGRAAKPFGFRPDDIFTLVNSCNFDFSVWEMWAPLAHGAAIRVVDRDVAVDPSGLLDLMQREGVTVYNVVPSAFRYIAKAAERRAGGLPQRLRQVFLGGEALDLDSLGRWRAAGASRPCQLTNLYGVTEGTVMSTFRHLGPEADSDAATSRNIGHALPGAVVRLRRDTPASPSGEIIIGGAGVAAGYLNRPELTSERFMVSPGGQREYRTGDLAGLRDDGDLEFLGRLDAQVKHNGYRIEPGEIEAALLRHPASGGVCVVLRGRAGRGVLTAYYTGAASPADLEAAAEAAGLPRHLRPARYQHLDAMPLNANGKVDRKALELP